MRHAGVRASPALHRNLPRNFSAESDRERLSPTAVGAIKEVANQWRITGTGMVSLLGVATR